ncbi:hypothetical protein CRENBAI_017067 [Crenichthys baileyi]|uniref:Uncharacterized protein n=1 Tax=Crenichthys baileyi TaxID=28760 RepID=A0AAV9R9R8_9TELE
MVWKRAEQSRGPSGQTVRMLAMVQMQPGRPPAAEQEPGRSAADEQESGRPAMERRGPSERAVQRPPTERRGPSGNPVRELTAEELRTAGTTVELWRLGTMLESGAGTARALESGQGTAGALDETVGYGLENLVGHQKICGRALKICGRPLKGLKTKAVCPGTSTE